MSTNTLTSLAILKVHVDQGKDYLDYLRPFILEVLIEHNPDPVTDSVVRHYIREQFGLEIPKRTIQIVLKRISRRYPLKRDHGVYRITGDLPDPQITAKQTHAERHISAVLGGTATVLTGHNQTDLQRQRGHRRHMHIPSQVRCRMPSRLLARDGYSFARRSRPGRYRTSQ